MRQSEAAYVVAHRTPPGGTQWLAQWNQGWQAYNFVGGHRKLEETYYECAVREVEEELGLQRGRDFSVAAEQRDMLRYQAWSRRANERTNYTIALFELTLLGSATERVNHGPENRWLREDEIRRCITDDGRAVSPTMAQVLTQARLWKDRENRGK